MRSLAFYTASHREAHYMKTLEDVIVVVQQLVSALHINMGPDLKFIPKQPEPRVPHILINTKDRVVRTAGGFSAPMPAGWVLKNVAMPKSQVALGLHPTAPEAIFVEHETLKEGETASPEELAALVAAAKPAG